MPTFAKRQNDRTGNPDLVLRQGGKVCVLDLMYSTDCQIIMVDGEWKSLIPSLRRLYIVSQLTFGNRPAQKL